MRLVFVLLLLLLPGSALAQTDALPPTPQQVVELAIDDFIRPAMAGFSVSTVKLEDAMGRLCAAPDRGTLDTARRAFGDAVLAHARIAFLRFGPLVEDNRQERLLFWPDRKGIALKQVQAALATGEETAASVDGLRQKSVAMQGFGALEFVLFGSDADNLATGSGYRCSYGLAVAGAIRRTARELKHAWMAEPGIATRMLSPTADDPDYRTTEEVLEDLVGAMAHGTEAIRDTRLLPFIGRDGAAPNARAALYWRSGMTMPDIGAEFAGIADLLRVSRIGEAGGADGIWASDAATFEFRNVVRALGVITGPTLADALADPKQLQGLRYLVILSQSLNTLFGERLSAALKLSVGFSSLDGD
nr:hypothetical protein GAGBIFFJ_00021 [uncultured bacterium]